MSQGLLALGPNISGILGAGKKRPGPAASTDKRQRPSWMNRENIADALTIVGGGLRDLGSVGNTDFMGQANELVTSRRDARSDEQLEARRRAALAAATAGMSPEQRAFAEAFPEEFARHQAENAFENRLERERFEAGRSDRREDVDFRNRSFERDIFESDRGFGANRSDRREDVEFRNERAGRSDFESDRGFAAGRADRRADVAFRNDRADRSDMESDRGFERGVYEFDTTMGIEEAERQRAAAEAERERQTIRLSPEQMGRIAPNVPALESAQRQLDELEAEGVSFTGGHRDTWATIAGGLPDWVGGGAMERVIGTDQRDRLVRANRAFEAAILPILSGAAVTDSEARRYVQAALPNVGDSPTTRALKREHRQAMLDVYSAAVRGEPIDYDAIASRATAVERSMASGDNRNTLELPANGAGDDLPPAARNAGVSPREWANMPPEDRALFED